MNKQTDTKPTQKKRGRPAKEPKTESKHVVVEEVVIDDALLDTFFKKERSNVTWYLFAKAVAVAVTTIVFGFFGALGIGLAAQLFL